MEDSASIEARKVRPSSPRISVACGAEKPPRKAAAISQGALSLPGEQQTAPSTPPPGSAGRDKVSLEFFQPQAREIFVAGTFNEWSPLATPLTPQGDGKWVAELSLGPGKYEYRFVVDGVWTDDPLSSESAPNPFGGFNSVLQVQPPQ